MKTFKVILGLILLGIFVSDYGEYVVDAKPLAPIVAYYKSVATTILLIIFYKDEKGIITKST